MRNAIVWMDLLLYVSLSLNLTLKFQSKQSPLTKRATISPIWIYHGVDIDWHNLDTPSSKFVWELCRKLAKTMLKLWTDQSLVTRRGSVNWTHFRTKQCSTKLTCFIHKSGEFYHWKAINNKNWIYHLCWWQVDWMLSRPTWSTRWQPSISKQTSNRMLFSE